MIYLGNPVKSNIYKIKFKGDEPLATDGWYIEVEENFDTHYYDAFLCREEYPIKVALCGGSMGAYLDLEDFCAHLETEAFDERHVRNFKHYMGQDKNN